MLGMAEERLVPIWGKMRTQARRKLIPHIIAEPPHFNADRVCGGGSIISVVWNHSVGKVPESGERCGKPRSQDPDEGMKAMPILVELFVVVFAVII